MGNTRALTFKQQRFCRSYAEHGNRIRAIQEAGYNVSNRHSASQLAHKLLKREHVRQEVSQLMELLYPDLPKLCSNVVVRIMNGEEKAATPSDRLRAVDFLCKIMGWYAK